MSFKNQMSVSTAIEADTKKDCQHSCVQNNYDDSISQNFNNSAKKFKIFEIDVFSQVKNMLDMRQTLAYYGLSVNSKGLALCPFHQEKTPSFKIYGNSYYCFGCGESGTVIDFVMKYFGLTNIEAVKRLNEDFGLNLPIGRSTGAANFRSVQGDKMLIEDFKEWEKCAFVTLSSYFKMLRFYGKQIYIHNTEYFKQYSDEVDNILFVETLLDLMIENTHNFEAQVEFYKNFGEVVTVIEHKLHS